jgi:Holliday junction resolvase
MLGQMEVKKGKARETRLAEKYRKKGFQVLNAKNYNTGVDILVIDRKTGQIKYAIESTNYAKESYMQKSRAERYAKSLDQFPYATKTLVVSFDENLGDEVRKILKAHKVRIKVEGSQDTQISL